MHTENRRNSHLHAGSALLAALLLFAPLSPADTMKEPDWRDGMRDLRTSTALDIEEVADTAWRRFATRMQFDRPRQIVAYSGYANNDSVWVQGRLLANRAPKGPHDDDDWWDNLKATYERWETDEVPGAEVELVYATQRKTVVTDDEGYYYATFSRDARYPRADRVTARYLAPDVSLSAEHHVTLVVPEAHFMVISDVDDTVIHTGITDLLLAAQLTFLNNAKTRKPLAGAAALYREIARAKDGSNPVLYVSNSGWNMYDLLRDFLDLNDFPKGPLLLRDLGFHSEEENTRSHKADTFRQLLERFPTLPVVMIGDSGQHDAELYAAAAREHPERVKAIYIRDVDPDSDSTHDTKVDRIISAHEGSVPMLRGADSTVFAKHMAQIGLLSAEQILAVQASVERDLERDRLGSQ